MRTAWPLLFLAVLGCRDPALNAAEGLLRLEPAEAELGEVPVGLPVEAVFEVHNDGRGPLQLKWQAEDGAFSLLDPPTSLSGGSSARVRARGVPVVAGPVEAHFSATAGDRSSPATLRATAIAPHVCVPTSTCLVSVWSEAYGRCVESPAPDEQPCDPGSACLQAARCMAGRCVGDAVSCDDHDRCTSDSCNDVSGCQHAPAPACPGDGRCMVGVCDPARGCGLAPAIDGTVCGRMGCDMADVCLGGQCIARVPPDGFVCADESPCQAEGRCVAQVCQQAPPVTLTPSWIFGAAQPDGGVPPESWSDVLISPANDVTLSSYFMSPPRLLAQAATPINLRSGVRRCMYWNDALVCADHPGTHDVSALDPASGQVRWTYSRVLQDLPFLQGPSRDTFLARLAVISSTQLAAVFESRTVAADGADTLCRIFAVVVLDTRGASLASWQVEDPLFDRCVHPHTFGVATDTSGNLYFAFTPSLTTNPASPALRETLLMSYSPSGQLRWKRGEPGLPGGELAVTQKLLLQAHSPIPWSTDDGRPLAPLPVPFGVGVATRTALIPSPVPGLATLPAVSSSSLTHLWDYTLPPPKIFASDQLRLATWHSPRGLKTVALSWARDRSALELLAVDAVTGLEAFSCPVALSGAPLAGEVASGGLAVMTAAQPSPSCEQCDPRFAWSSNRFHWLAVPGLSAAVAPWPGTHGGAGHSHQENQAP